MTLSQSLDEIEKRCPSGIERIDHECILKLLEAIRVLSEALELTATPQNQIHTLHPKCFCSSCNQKEALQKAQEILK